MSFLVKFLKLDFAIANKIKQVNETAPVFSIITTENKSFNTLIEAGRVMQYLWLKASSLGLDFQPITVLPYLTGLDENTLTKRELRIVDDCSKNLSELWDIKEAQHLVSAFRLGYAAKETIITNRREAKSFLKS